MTIRAVLGDVELVEGPILGHEHLQIDLSHNKGLDVVLGPEEEEDVTYDLSQTVMHHGLKAVSELSVIGSGRNVEALRRISRKAGLSIISATGFYWDPVPELVNETPLEKLRDAMIGDIERGAEDSDIRCGTIKIGIDHGDPTSMVEKIFVAAVGAAKATGAAVVTHTSRPEQAAWQIDVLEGAGMDLSHVLISHLHGFRNFADLLAVGARGVFIGIDQLGSRKGPSFESMADLVCRAIDQGLAKQLILSADIARRSRLITHGGRGYATVFTEFLPLLRERGVADTVIDGIMFENPKNILSLRR